MVRRLLGRASGAAAVVAALWALGCGSQSKYMEDEQWSKEAAPNGGAWREGQALFTPEESEPESFDTELNGVRLDLTMDPQAEPTARCTCLDVAAGRPGDKAFAWGPEVPTLSGEQMVVAMRSEGAECPGDPVEPGLRRASIKAVDQQGNHVIVVIEKLPVGRPLAQGAVTNRPKPGGSLYFRPANKLVPYGGALGGQGMCRVFTRGAN